ncbi:MAG TPA: hypothetical protein VIY50_07265 [Steroidobacteraceae bacterium]
MLKHGITLAMFIIGDLMIVIGSLAIGSSMGTTIIGLALLAIGFGIEVNVWSRVSRPRRADSVQPSR